MKRNAIRKRAYFGKYRLKRLRKALGITQHAMALNMGVTQSCIASWELGRNAVPSWAARELLVTEAIAAVKAARKKKLAKKRATGVDATRTV